MSRSPTRRSTSERTRWSRGTTTSTRAPRQTTARRAEETDAECEFVDFVQRPQWQLEERMVWLGVAVVVALLVLIVFMIILAT